MKFLLAVDGSAHSQAAAGFLARIAARRSHEVTVLHVTPPVIPAPAGARSITGVLRDSGEKMAASYEEELRRNRFLKPAAAMVESNDAAGSILDRASKERAHLIILGARGLTPLKTFLLGSVSQKVSRHADASVLIVRRPPRGELKVLAAVDGSTPGRRALQFLSRLGLSRRSRITLVHAVVYPLFQWTTGDFPVYSGQTITAREELAALRRRGRGFLEQAKKDLVPHFDRVQTVLVEGPPAGALLDTAKARSADLIVVGRRGLSRLDRFLLGSVSQKVSVYADCSVLIAK